MRRIALLCLAFLVNTLLLVSTKYAMAQDQAGFPDVPKTHWAYEAVTELKQKGILIGYPPDTSTHKAGDASKDRSVSPPRTHTNPNRRAKKHR